MIYFIQCSITGRIKIGFASDAERRFAELKTGSPTELVLLGTRDGGRSAEVRYHGRFTEHRLHGEWFSPHEDLLSTLRDYGFEPLDYDWREAYEREVQRAADERIASEIGARKWAEIYDRGASYRDLKRRFYKMVDAWAALVDAVLDSRGFLPPADYRHNRGEVDLHVSGTLWEAHEFAIDLVENDGDDDPPPDDDGPAEVVILSA